MKLFCPHLLVAVQVYSPTEEVFTSGIVRLNTESRLEISTWDTKPVISTVHVYSLHLAAELGEAHSIVTPLHLHHRGPGAHRALYFLENIKTCVFVCIIRQSQKSKLSSTNLFFCHICNNEGLGYFNGRRILNIDLDHNKY